MGTTARKLPLLFAFSFFFMLSPAWAGDGNSLLKNCQMAERLSDGDKTVPHSAFIQSGLCIGLIQGVKDTMVRYTDLLREPGVPSVPFKKICFPDKISNEQAIRVVLKYLRDNPNELHLYESDLVIIAFFNAFECK